MRIIPVLVVLSACTPDLGPPTCEGGGEPLLELGDGGQTAFVPFSNGATIPTRGEPLSADLDLWTSGLDITAGVTAVVRISEGGGPSEDSLATLTLSCQDSGNGWTSVLAALPAGAVSGAEVVVEAVLTDATGVTITAEISGVLE